MTRRTTAILAGIALLGVSGCSGKDPVHSEKRELSPVFIGTPLITRMTPVIEAVTGPDSVRSISFANVPWFDSITNGDIWLRATAMSGATNPIFVLDQVTHDWHEIEGALPLEGACFEGCRTDVLERLLSQEFGQSVRRCLDSVGSLRIGGQRFWGHTARLIEYNPEYEFRTIRQAQLVRYWSAALARRGDTVVMFSTHRDTATDQLVDSLIKFDLLANRLTGQAAQYRELVDVAIGQEGIWRIELGSTRDTIVCRSENGTILHQFEFGPRFSARTICERDGRVWIASPSRQGEVDVAASDSAGVCIFAKVMRFSASTSLTRHQSGFAALGGVGLIVMDSIGQMTEEYGLPVGNVSAILSDDETIWVTHTGPRGIYTDATLLTRFRLE